MLLIKLMIISPLTMTSVKLGLIHAINIKGQHKTLKLETEVLVNYLS